MSAKRDDEMSLSSMMKPWRKPRFIATPFARLRLEQGLARLWADMESEMQVKSEIAGSVWKIIAAPGTALAADDVIVILESMKMEIPVTAPKAGTLSQLHVAEGDMIGEGQLIATLD